MKKFKKILSAIICVAILLTVTGATVFAASSTYKKGFRGDSSYSSGTVSVGTNEDISLSSSCKVTIDPDTTSRSITYYVAIKKSTWYGSKVVAKSSVDKSWGNTSSLSTSVKTCSQSCSYTTGSSSKDYFVYAKVSGSSSAYYNYFTLTLSY